MRYERIRTAGVLLGTGLGGFLDGIVLHPNPGWLQVATWVVSLAGVFVLWSGVRGAGRLPSTRTLCGYMLIGWGAFNLVEGSIDHHLLGLHHVRGLPFYDWVFLLAGGVGFIFAGLALRDGRHRVPAFAEERRSGERRMA